MITYIALFFIKFSLKFQYFSLNLLNLLSNNYKIKNLKICHLKIKYWNLKKITVKVTISQI